MDAPRLGVELELHLPASTTATAIWDLGHICDLHHSSQQHGNLNPPSGAGDCTCILMDTSGVHYCWATTGTPYLQILRDFFLSFRGPKEGQRFLLNQRQLKIFRMSPCGVFWGSRPEPHNHSTNPATTQIHVARTGTMNIQTESKKINK